MRILFVCLGNICRSPAAEAVMKTLVTQAGLNDHIFCDSAGTSAYHEGELADPRMIRYARERGHEITSLSRPFRSPQDFADFDLILTMDQSNYRNVLFLDSSSEFRAKVQPITQYCRIHKVDEVPDPYYQEEIGFQLVLDILEDACAELLIKIKDLKQGSKL